jgi:hypothetical protein
VCEPALQGLGSDMSDDATLLVLFLLLLVLLG